MALQDWLNPTHTTTERAGLANPSAKLATISKPLAKADNHQDTDLKRITTEISTISRISISNTPEQKNAGLARLTAAVEGLPATVEELAEYFKDDMPTIASGSVTVAGIQQASEWVCYRLWGREPTEASMVMCKDCQRESCEYRGRFVDDYPRWCSLFVRW